MMSCAGDSKEQTETVSESNQKANDRSCLADLSDQTKWYPTSAVASLVNQPEENIKQSILKGVFNSCSYKWKSDRTHIMKAGNIEMEVPTKNFINITIKNLDDAIEKASRMVKDKTFTYTEYFDGFHTLANTEEQKKIDELIDKEAEEDKNVETGKKLLALVKTENFTVIDNLGDKANTYVKIVTGLRETRLSVLYGNVVLIVAVDISDEDAEDLAVAKTVAEAVLALCN